MVIMMHTPPPARNAVALVFAIAAAHAASGARGPLADAAATIDAGGGIDEAVVKRGRVDVGSKEGPPAEGVDFVGRVEAARLSAGADPRRDFEACGGICGPKAATASMTLTRSVTSTRRCGMAPPIERASS